jgi:hypothetical protein
LLSNFCPPSNSCLLSSTCSLSTSCPLSLCLDFSFSSTLIVFVFVEVARVEGVGSSEVGWSGKVKLLVVVLVVLAVEVDAVKEDSGFLKRFKGSRSWHHSDCHKGGCRRGGFYAMLLARVRVLEADQRRIKLVSGRDSVRDNCSRQSRHGSSWF